MNIDEKRLKQLFFRWYQNQASENETYELLNGLAEADRHGFLAKFMREAWQELEADVVFTDEEKQKILQDIVLKQNTPAVPSSREVAALNVVEPKRTTNVRKLWVRWGAAAAVFLGVLFTGYVVLFKKNDTNQQGSTKDILQFKNDVPAPAINKATITLANGKVIVLDSADKEQLALQGGVTLVKLADGKIIYKAQSGGILKELVYNTLTNPRGSKVIDMTLSDGTKIWLNAGSSITYPVAFAGNERKVSITGEAYFEVNPRYLNANEKMPFIVSKGDMRVTVLGTHFNVNAYDDESSIKITLVEGSVKVSSGNRLQSLIPGQQAIVGNNAHIELVKNANVDEATAWIQGIFQFTDADVTTIMRQVSRWYNVDVFYKVKPALSFGGKIDRGSSLIQVLTILETSGLHFSVDGNKVTVLP